jgi:Fur family ferric uptake transcriptional regulator
MVADLAAAGRRLTGPRLAVVNALERGPEHMSPADVLAEAVGECPTLNRASVYRTLELLTGLGLIRPLFLGDGVQRFALVRDGHHHLICSGCGSLTDFDECQLGSVWQDLAERHGFTMEGHLVEIFGRCRECAA